MKVFVKKNLWILVPLALLAFIAVGAWVLLKDSLKDSSPSAPSNSLMVLEPYRRAGTWVFDDPAAGLKAEPFINGVPQLIDKLLADAKVADPEGGFRLTFSAAEFPGWQEKVIWRRSEMGGNWYYSAKYDIEGWLCPSLFKYFRKAPPEIFIKVEAKEKP